MTSPKIDFSTQPKSIFQGVTEPTLSTQAAIDMRPKQRRYAPSSLSDSICCDKQGKQIRPCEDVDFFNDASIIKFHRADTTEILEMEYGTQLEVSYVKGKAVLQQQSKRGCTAAATAMLIIDAGRKDKIPDLIRELGNPKAMRWDIEQAGLNCIEGQLEKGLVPLKELINSNGPAIVSVDGNVGGHVIIVDAISED